MAESQLAYEEVQAALDVIGQTPGAIMIRTVEGWRELKPGAFGQVLAIGEDGIPAWFWIDELPTGP